jgi:hypothetical protein
VNKSDKPDRAKVVEFLKSATAANFKKKGRGLKSPGRQNLTSTF